MSFDFSNAQLPRLLPLENSYAENDVEDDLKRLFLDLFTDMLALGVFDMNVLGAAHLGSFDLVRKSVNSDGLVLLPGAYEDASTRYIYRAWKAGNTQGRGLHFMRTYLQLLFPNIGDAIQLWQSNDGEYPTHLHETQQPDTFLTSRVRILIHDFPSPESVQIIMRCMVHAIPARFVIELRHLATSSVGKIQPAAVGSMTQSLRSAGLLKAEPHLQARSIFTPAVTIHGGQHLRSYGGAS